MVYAGGLDQNGRTSSIRSKDTAWSPFDDSIVASGGDDGKVMIWKVEASAFDGWGQEHWVPQDFNSVARIDGSARRKAIPLSRYPTRFKRGRPF
jgi:hypothetical protein